MTFKYKIIKIHLSPKIFDFVFLSQKEARIGRYFFDDELVSSPGQERSSSKKSTLISESGSNPLKNISKLKKLLLKNTSEVQIWDLWKSFYNVLALSNYSDLPIEKNISQEVILKDINRTFPNHPFFSSEEFGHYGQFALYRVLCKFSSTYPSVGYCQGMNYIVAFLLLVSGSHEEEVFSFFVELCDEFNLFKAFSEDMEEMHRNLWIFDRLFEYNFPELRSHFLENEITEDMWIFKWILSLFTTSLNLHTTARIWGYLLSRGIRGLFEVSFGILNILKSDLLRSDLSEILKTFEELPSSQLSWKKLLNSSKKFKIKSSKLEKLRKEYQNIQKKKENFRYLDAPEDKNEGKRGKSQNLIVQEITETLDDLPLFFKSKSGYSTPNRPGNLGPVVKGNENYYKMGRVSFVEDRTIGEDDIISKQFLDDLINEKTCGDSFIIQVCNSNK
jgi:hypothetical protein